MSRLGPPPGRNKNVGSGCHISAWLCVTKAEAPSISPSWPESTSAQAVPLRSRHGAELIDVRAGGRPDIVQPAKPAGVGAEDVAAADDTSGDRFGLTHGVGSRCRTTSSVHGLRFASVWY